MAPIATQVLKQVSNKEDIAMDTLFQLLDEAIDDMEQGRVQTLDEAWEEIDAV